MSVESIGLKDLNKEEYKFDYADDNFAIGRNRTQLLGIHNAIRLDFLLIITCSEGVLQLDINSVCYKLRKGFFITCLPSSIISNILFSADLKINIIAISPKFLETHVKLDDDTVEILNFIFKNPIHNLPYENILEARFFNYAELLITTSSKIFTRYGSDIREHILGAISYDILTVFNRIISRANSQRAINTCNVDTQNRTNYIFRKFIEEVSKDGGIHRSIPYFAERLCYSPRYISMIVKKVSGKTAIEWINEYAIEQIKILLKYTDLSMKEIADRLEFPNQSFFGKFVKTHLGVSPNKYRGIPENSK